MFPQGVGRRRSGRCTVAPQQHVSSQRAMCASVVRLLLSISEMLLARRVVLWGQESPAGISRSLYIRRCLIRLFVRCNRGHGELRASSKRDIWPAQWSLIYTDIRMQ